MKLCLNCSKELIENQDKFCGRSCVGSYYGKQHKLTTDERRAKWRQRGKKYWQRHKARLYEKRKYKAEDYQNLGYAYKRNLLWRIKRRAEEKQLSFDLQIEDIQIPSHCPVLGIKLEKGKGSGVKDYSPSLDRIVPFLGYVKGNVIVVSHKANRIKSDASLSELQKVADFYTKLLKT